MKVSERSAMIHVQEIDHRSKEYARLVQDDEDAVLYQDPLWLQILEETLGMPPRILALRENGDLKAAIPYMISLDKPLGPVINSLPFFGSIGSPIFGRVPAQKKRECLQELLQALLTRAAEMEALSVNLICRPGDPLEGAYREVLRPDFEDLRTTHILSFPRTGEDTESLLLGSLEGRTRTALRKALKQAFEITPSTDVEDLLSFYGLHSDNMRVLGGWKKPERFMKSVAARLHEGAAELWVARKSGRVAAGALFFIYRDMAEYYMSGLDPRFRAQQPLSLVLFEVMKSLMERGLRRLNFGGTWPTQEGLKKFKSGWGGTPMDYRYFVKLGKRSSNLFSMTPSQISNAYPYFYVIPFHLLSSASKGFPGTLPQPTTYGFV